MYLARYRFAGHPDELESAYQRLSASFPPDTLDLRIAVRHVDGLDVYDACPDEETFRSFSVSAQFHGVLTNAGLPTPQIDGIGDIVAATLNQPVG